MVFFNDTATTESYTRSLHDALPISPPATSSTAMPLRPVLSIRGAPSRATVWVAAQAITSGLSTGSSRVSGAAVSRSEEHTSELQSRQYLVCRLLLEKKQHRRRTRDP